MLSSKGAPATEALLTFSDSRESALDFESNPMPEVAAPRAEDIFDLAGVGGPAFMRNFEVIMAGGAVPLSGAEVPEVTWWGRHRDPLARGTWGSTA